MAYDARDVKDVLQIIRKDSIRFIHLWFTDILGQLKSLSIAPAEFERALGEGKNFDGSSIEGFARIFESDMVAFPDPSTFQVLPRGQQGHRVACMICDILTPDGHPYDGDPRHVLRRALERIRGDGLKFNVGPELEYFYFSDARCPKTLDNGGYFDLTPLDISSELREKTVVALEAMGIQVEAFHHEVATSQHELDLRYCDALKMADQVMTTRLIIKEIARENGVYATFMPKPLFAQNGSGMHIHESLFQEDKNYFYDSEDPFRLSTAAKGFVAGQLKHAKEFVSVTNQWVNSYKRLVPGYEAPAYVSWGQKNRSALVRVPAVKQGRDDAVRAELRVADPACNPYLAFAVILMAGVSGMENSYELPPAIERDIYVMSPGELEEEGIETLPDSLFAAIQLTEKSALVREALGNHLFEKFVENKKIEWERYRVHVTQFEVERYLPVL